MMNNVMLACSRRAVCRRRILLPSLTISNSSNNSNIDNNNIFRSSVGTRWYSSTKPTFDEKVATKAENDKNDKKALRQIALEYGKRKAAYKRHVSKLRKDYMEEYQRHKAEDEAQRDAELAETTRKRLERQRAKNERSVQNAIRQKELQRQAYLAFQDHLKAEQEKRDAKAILFNKARQLAIDDLEEEAPLWLTTPEEVEAAFTHENEQLLWGRPHGVLGAPNPSLDSHFWQYETHTWDMSKTYKTQRDRLLEQLEEEAYYRTNIDPKIWTPERIAEYEALERKAKLRANVRSAGRKQLLKLQREYLEEEHETQPGEPPKPPPIPSLGVLANVKAQEREGSELLFKDPTQFFIFDGDRDASSSEGDNNNNNNAGEGDAENSDDMIYSGPSLGAPVSLKDPLRGDPNGSVFPMGIGKMPKPDTRSEKEKKREEREQRLWAAAQAQAKGGADGAVDAAADDELEMYGEPIDYDNISGWDSDDEEWEKGLDPVTDADILAIPHQYRYREEDLDWVIEQLKSKAEDLQSHLRARVTSLEQDKRAKMQRDDGGAAVVAEGVPAAAAADGSTSSGGASAADDSESSGKFFDEASAEKLRSVGGDVDKFEALMASFSDEQLLSIYALESKKQTVDVEAGESLFDTVPGLTAEQIAGLTELEKLLHEAEDQAMGGL